MFKYETHVHSKEGSACALSSACEMVQAMKFVREGKHSLLWEGDNKD